MRGGTSNGLMFRRADLPADRGEWDAIFLAAMGSPDPYGRQLDGMGGGISSLSKVCVVGTASRPDADVDYTFAQVSVTGTTVDYAGNCGNMSSAIGPFAVSEGMVGAPSDGPVCVRIHNTNTGKVIHAHFEMAGGAPATEGDFALDGVAGTASPIRLDFMNPAGAKTGRLLPSGAAQDVLNTAAGPIRVSMVDATNPFVFVDGRDVGLSGAELPADIQGDAALLIRLEEIRAAASVVMGLATDRAAAAAMIALPKIAMLFPMRAAPTLSGREIAVAEADILSRTISVGQAHNAIPLTGALCLATAMRTPGTIAHDLSRAAPDAPSIRIAHPSGTITVDAEVAETPEGPTVLRASAYRSARLLFEGFVRFRM